METVLIILAIGIVGTFININLRDIARELKRQTDIYEKQNK